MPKRVLQSIVGKLAVIMAAFGSALPAQASSSCHCDSCCTERETTCLDCGCNEQKSQALAETDSWFSSCECPDCECDTREAAKFVPESYRRELAGVGTAFPANHVFVSNLVSISGDVAYRAPERAPPHSTISIQVLFNVWLN